MFQSNKDLKEAPAESRNKFKQAIKLVKKHKKLLSLDTKYIAGIKSFEYTMANINKVFKERPEEIRTRIPIDHDALKLLGEKKHSSNHNYECIESLYKHIEKLEYDSPCSYEECSPPQERSLLKLKDNFDGIVNDYNTNQTENFHVSSARTILNSPRRDANTVLDLASNDNRPNSDGNKNCMTEEDKEKDCWGDVVKDSEVEEEQKPSEDPSLNF